jgi:uncharacterized surface anchored protein
MQGRLRTFTSRKLTGVGLLTLAGSLVASLAFAGTAAAKPASTSTAPPADCTSGSTIASGTCTLYTPNGTFNADGTLSYTYDATTQQLTITLSGIGTITAGPWLCIGPNDMNAYLQDPADVCTTNGVLATGPGQSQIFPVSSSGDTFVFDVPVGDFWFIHLSSGGNTLVAASPPLGSGSVTVTKKDASTAALLSGAAFTLFTDNGGAPGTSTGLSCATDSTGTCTLGPVVAGNYVVEETTPPTGYTAPTPDYQVVAVVAGGTAAVTFEDTAVPTTGQITVTKTDNANPAKPLDGAVFTLFTDSSGAPGTSTGLSCTTSGAAGQCTIANLTPGNYVLEETTAPTGYNPPSPDYQAVTVTAGSTATLSFVDTPVTVTPTTFSVVIDKTDNADPAKPLQGAGFALYQDTSGTIGSAVAGATCVTNASGTCTITDVPAGTYFVVETSAPSGYSAAANQTVTVGSDTATPTLTFVDTPVPTTGSATLTKVDNASPANVLAGAALTLFTDNAGSPGTSTGLSCITTLPAGECTISGITPGTYFFVETTAPTGFSPAVSQLVTVVAGEVTTATFVDDPVIVNSSGGSSSSGGSTTTGSSSGSSSTVIPAASPGPSEPVAGATTARTGEAFAGSRLWELLIGAAGLLLIGLGERTRRRAKVQAVEVSRW